MNLLFRSFVKLWEYAKAGYAYTLGLYWHWLSSVMPEPYNGDDSSSSKRAFAKMSRWRQNVSDEYACAVCYGGSLAAYLDNRNIYHRWENSK